MSQASPHEHSHHDHSHHGHDHAGHDHAGHDHAGHDHGEHDHGEHDHGEHGWSGENIHVFLGQDHTRHERRTWWVIGLCVVMMAVEIGGGALFGSMALIADGLHMSTHAAALLIAALAYGFARRHATDPRFTFGTGKLGDLAGFASAIILAMIALLIGYEAMSRLFRPIPIAFGEAIPIAALGLVVNLASAWLLGGDGHHHHGHEHSHGDDHKSQAGEAADRDHNMRAAFIHVLGDAAVSVLAIVGLTCGRLFGWVWMDPVMGIVGALVIASWSATLIRDTGGILLDMTPDRGLEKELRKTIESDGDKVTDLHLWRLGPGHLGAIISVATSGPRDCEHYRARLRHFPRLSHVTVEVRPQHETRSKP